MSRPVLAALMGGLLAWLQITSPGGCPSADGIRQQVGRLVPAAAPGFAVEVRVDRDTLVVVLAGSERAA
jgi:hypothetical protein